MPQEPGGPRDIIHTPGVKENFHGRDFYGILGLRKEDNPTQAQITSAYRKRQRELHPDKHPEDPKYYDELFK